MKELHRNSTTQLTMEGLGKLLLSELNLRSCEGVDLMPDQIQLTIELAKMLLE